MATTGVRQRHGRACDGSNIRCRCPWVGSIYSRRHGKKIRRQFSTRAEAVAWVDEARSAVRRRVLQPPSRVTLGEAAESWLRAAQAGEVRPRSGHEFKPGTIRSYATAFRLRISPELGHYRLSAIGLNDLQDFIDRLRAQGLAPATIGVTSNMLRCVFARSLKRGEISVNPTTGLEMPAVRGGRDRIATPAEASRLLAALPASDRPVWATALYGGLRRGELMGLRVEDIDLAAGTIRIERGWDLVAGAIPTKSRKSRRVPIPAALRDHLDEHLLGLDDWRDRPDGLVFGLSPTAPFSPTALSSRAARAWEEAGLERIGLHECRHTCASLLIASGVNIKAVQSFLGHSSITTTLDKYGHLLDGAEAEAAVLLDAYLEHADSAARIAQLA